MKTLNFIIATALLLVAAQRHSFAGSATWDQNPTSSDWNTATNWTPPTVPNGVSDTATFETSDVTKIAISSTIRLASCIFDQGASGFRITSDDSGELTFDGAGVINNSTNPQSFVVKLDGENFSFVNEATIAGLVRFVVKGSSIG
jgi:hypothetical protein